ncbi:hypothetical protein SHAM105786_10395 [Shewanella amazonensis]
MAFKPQIRIPATYMRGGPVGPASRYQPLRLVAAKKCDFSLPAGTDMSGGSSLCR